MSFDYSKLLGKIKECGYTQEGIAEKIGINNSTFSQKINGKAYFKQKEIADICSILNLSAEETVQIFFTAKV